MRLGSIAAVLLLATALTFAEEDAKPPKPVASMLPPAPFVTTTAAPKTTTEANITTVAPTTHNATTPNVTTLAPTTHNATTPIVTTIAPTTHNATTPNVTTVAPTTHNATTPNVTTVHPTTASPSPTPGPTSPTNITVGNYTMKEGNKLCVMVQSAIQIRVNNSQMQGTYIVPGNNLPTNGKCDNNTAVLNIDVKEGRISMTFFRNDTSNAVFVTAVAVNITYAFKPRVSSTLQMKNDSVQLFSMATSHSYSCKSESVFMGSGTYLEFHQERIQAFNFTNNQFGPLDMCKADKPDYRVAIGVGVVLLILIIIVVVAYLISRRRRTDGYQAL